MEDLISRQDAIDAIEKYDFNFPEYMERFVTELRDAMKEDLKDDIVALPSAETPTVSEKHQLSEETPTNTPTDLISRQDAIEAVATVTMSIHLSNVLCDKLLALPSAEPKIVRDCTELVRWLIDEVMDEENWELNAVAYGEIICRKLKKLGLLDVEDGYYVETQKTGEWIEVEVRPEVYDIEGVETWGSKMQCDQCGFIFTAIEGHITQYNFCPNCGAKMGG